MVSNLSSPSDGRAAVALAAQIFVNVLRNALRGCTALGRICTILRFAVLCGRSLAPARVDRYDQGPRPSSEEDSRKAGHGEDGPGVQGALDRMTFGPGRVANR
jgi:hypothetical protein